MGFGRDTQRAKPVSESIVGNFENHEINDAIYSRIASTDVAEKQIVAREIADKLAAMSEFGDVVLLPASVS